MVQIVSAKRALISGLSFLSQPRMWLPFIGILASTLIFLYFGIYQYLGLYFQNPLNNVYAYQAGDMTVAMSLSFVLAFILFSTLFIEFAVMIRYAVDNNLKASIGRIFLISLKTYPRFLVSALLQGLLALGGAILLIVPVFYLGPRTLFVSVLTVYEDLGPFTALSKSNKLTKPIFLRCLMVFAFYVVLGSVLMYLWGNVGFSTFYKFIFDGATLSFLLIAFMISTISLFNQLNKSAYARGGFSYLESHIKSLG